MGKETYPLGARGGLGGPTTGVRCRAQSAKTSAAAAKPGNQRSAAVAVAVAAVAIASGEAAADLTSPAIHKGKARSRAEPGDAVGLAFPQRTASAGNEPHAMATAAPSRMAAVRASAPLAWLATASAATQNTIATTQAARRRAAARRSSVAVLHRAGMDP